MVLFAEPGAAVILVPWQRMNILYLLSVAAPVLDCHQACAPRLQEAAAYARALETWQNGERLPAQSDGRAREVFDLLGTRTEEKLRLVRHLVGKLKDSWYRVYDDKDENLELTEARIQHLQICNYNWKENLRIVLREIGAGKRLVPWGGLPGAPVTTATGGFSGHGGCPDRVAELSDIMSSAAAWAEGRTEEAGEWAKILGEPTREKQWLVACLCKHVSVQHRQFEGERLLAKPHVVESGIRDK